MMLRFVTLVLLLLLPAKEAAAMAAEALSPRETGQPTGDRSMKLPASLSSYNAALTVTLHTSTATLTVLDRRTQQSWAQQPFSKDVVLQSAAANAGIEIGLKHIPSGLDLKMRLQLEGELPELTATLSGEGDLPAPVRFPHPFVSDPGTYLVVPMNEGISFPVEDKSISPMRLIAYGGHGICMAFWGATDGEKGYAAIIETPDDASIRIDRLAGNLLIAPEWDPQKRRFGYERRLRYVFFDRGGHVAICKRYRAYAQEKGLVKTLQEKRKANPTVDLLIGAVNVWCWEKEALSLVQEMNALGIERILWSNRQSPEALRALNEAGILTSRYDIFQDVMNPENFKLLRGVHPDWPTAAWPRDLMIGSNGDWIKGWQVRGKDDQMYPCGVLCDKQALPYARKRMEEELKTHAYRCRFIDTTTASPWRECYHPEHPMTRSESRQWKMDLLRYVSEETKLVTGSETGHDAAVPYVHYFEGMLSLGPYRVPDAGRQMQKIWEEVPDRVAKFQVGHAYRLPLWELVYHDCVVSQWYWGDYNNKLPALWDKRNLFNILYGTPPMFMFNRETWQKNKARFVQSYKNVCPVARAVGYSEMTGHRFLIPDRSVQQTEFANGTTVTVNFGEKPYGLSDGVEVPAGGFHVSEAKL
ncbi:MAG: glycoside hydrolase [Verrucomicrobiota bacterium]